MKGYRNYIAYAFIMTVSVIGLLIVIRIFPAFSVAGMELKRADIISDALKENPFPEDNNIPVIPLNEGMNDSLLMADMEIENELQQDSSEKEIPIFEEEREAVFASDEEGPVLRIEDYSEDGKALMKFADALKGKGQNPVRIAVMGDSFMEGDILSADLREYLQGALGGKGVGFVPVTSIVSRLRQTVKHDFEGWNTYSIKQANNDSIDNKFTIGGYVYVPESDDATVKYKVSGAKKHLKGVSKASFFFINGGNTIVHAVVNDSSLLTFRPETSPELQRIVIDGQGVIESLSFSFENTEGFYAYGVMLDGKDGVSVDNYADRGSSGLQFYKLKQPINNQYNKYADYNLIILEYGLNIVSQGIYTYDAYERQMANIVEKIKLYYPDASIVIMGVSDRSYKENGEYRTMPEIKGMIRAQRRIAQRCKVAYWDTFSAMGGENSMVRFVEKRWAAKDYTHISSAGARVIAKELARTLLYETEILSLFTSEEEGMLMGDSVVQREF